jgi:hypothetical protein
MKEKFAKLIDVKTIITFALVGATIAFAASGKIDAKEVSSLALMAVSFFFGVKAMQKDMSK